MNDKLFMQRILIVDDIPENIDIIGGVLWDFRRIVALTGEKAIQIAMSENPPDLILLDIMMPGLDGYEVCRQLKANENTRNIPVIFVTAKSEIEDEQKGLELGAIDYVTKPISPPVVRARVINHLELKLARERLETQNKALIGAATLREDIERITRHDLKTPLNAIISLPNVIRLYDNLNDKQRSCLNTIEEAGLKMLKMINLSLDIVKMERGMYEIKLEYVDMVPLVVKILRELKELAISKDLSLNLSANGNSFSEGVSFIIQGEELLFYSMLANLIKNAFEASPVSEPITISFEYKSGAALIHIHNKGEVPETIRSKFFEKYVTSGKKSGTGLGTYSAKLIAETHGGSIHLNTSKENGTTVTVRMPQ